jgi:hypothetical protein
VLVCAGALGLGLPAATLDAQTTGALSGTVRDTEKAVIPGASVILTNTKDSKSRRSTVSNGAGFFTINAIQPGTYDLVVTMKNFDRYKVTGIEVHPGDEVTIETISMKIGQVEQEVTVSATAAGVNLDSPEKSSLITAEDLKRLSTVGRDATELIKFLPGFAVSTGGGLGNTSTNNNSQTMGFGSSSVSSFSANGATPQTGATTVISDGSSVTDPGDFGASISNINMDQVAEIKVQTSNFGADSAKGPVVINAVGKSGGSSYHGSVYYIVRNGGLNANDWYNDYNSVDRPPSKYNFPGANVGGPVRIPGTDFNHSKKLTFFTGFEYYDQTVFDQLLLSFIPTPRMLGGDLTNDAIDAALNVPSGTSKTQCPQFYTSTAVPGQPGLGNSGGICYSPGLSDTTYTQQDQRITPSSIGGCMDNFNVTPPIICLLPVDPRALIYSKFWPAINRTPRAAAGLLSDGYNYQKAQTSTHNGYQYRARVDENISDSTKLYVTYNFETINDETPIDNTFYAGSDIIPYPTPAFSHTRSHTLSLNFTKVFSPSLTNELVAAGTYFYLPDQLANRSLVSDATTGWTGGRYYANGATQLPGIVDYEEGVPDFAMGYFPAASAFLRKFSYNGGDNLTKQIKTHSVKLGVYAEETANNQVPYSYTQGNYAFNHYNAGCTTDDGMQTSQLQNNVANFLQGCAQFTQASSSTPSNLHFKTLDFYATDEWKATKKLTLTYGVRFDHLQPWTDPHGNGLAVWTPPAQHILYENVTADPRTFPGISWHKTDPAIPLTGQKSRALFYSPRAGLAYDLYGNGKTVIRGGWGAYRFHDSYNDSAGAEGTALGIQNYTTSGNLSCTLTQIQNTVGGGNVPAAGTQGVAGKTCASSSGQGSVPAFTLYALDPHDDQQPVTYNYNFTVDQAMPGNSDLELSYVGNQSAHTFTAGTLSNQNFIPLGGLFKPDPLTGAVTYPGANDQVTQDYRPYPNYTYVYVPNHIGYGNYNSFQASWNKQKGAFIYRVNYTWAKALGIRGDYRTGMVGDPSTLRNNYGYLGFNRNHALNFTYSWQVGHIYHGNKYLATAVNNWEFSGITGLQSGPDVAVLTGNGNFGLGGGLSYTPTGSSTSTAVSLSNSLVLGTPDITLQPVVTCDPKHGLHKDPKFGTQYINGNCFALPQLGSNGTFNLPDIHGPAYFNSDLTVQRDFKVKEKQEFEIRMAGFNFLNHPLPAFVGGSLIGLNLNFSDPANFVATSPQAALAAAYQSSTNFGYTPYKQGFRILEFQARYNF